MAEQYPQGHANNTSVVPPAETTDRGCFDFNMKKKEEKPQEDLVMTDMNSGKRTTEEDKHTLMDELQRTNTHSSSSSEEEVEEGRERKKKKKKGLKEAIKEKISGDKGEEAEEHKYEEQNNETVHSGEKKGFLEKIKEKLPGQDKNGSKVENTQIPIASDQYPENDTKEKKGIIDKIKEKLPGHHNKNNENHELKED
ncbi:hypothetical protein BUALT_Bualt15G0002800 [Buddleja alternifolia]|uniref:Dehydrin n=1 Tax=Buddleja alternifolia TaxID=168488 RepID=A0AAV6WGS8_9LAMI|nr:hypothetical protein BUALT_Bualt15G0002800 [Buddleja alternifolia]